MIFSRIRLGYGALAKASIISMPLLFHGCSGANANQPPVVVIPQARPAFPDPEHDTLPASKDTVQARSATALNISSPDDKHLEARLSVIRPDNSLDRVILDPKVTFYYQTSASKWEQIPGCISVSTCGIPSIAGRGKTASMIFEAAYQSESGSGLAASVSEPYLWEAGQASRTTY